MKIFGWIAVLLAVLLLDLGTTAIGDEKSFMAPELNGYYVAKMEPDYLLLRNRSGKEVEIPNVTNLQDYRRFLDSAKKNHESITLLVKFFRDSYADFHVEIWYVLKEFEK